MDHEIWDKIKSGNKKAFRLLFNQYYSSLCLYANSIINNIQLSQDIVSECFIRIWERRENIQINSSVKQYLLLTVRNAVYSYLRSPESRKIDINTIIDSLENTPTIDYDLETDEVIVRIYRLIEKMPEQRKKIFELATIKGKSYKEVAEILGISVNTVNTQISRAYRYLRDELGNEGLLLWLFVHQNKKN